MKIVTLLFKIFVSIALLVGLGIGSFIYYETVQKEVRIAEEAKSRVALEQDLKIREAKVLAKFTSGEICFYLKPAKGFRTERDSEYSYGGNNDLSLPETVIHHNKLVGANGVQVTQVIPTGRSGRIDELKFFEFYTIQYISHGSYGAAYIMKEGTDDTHHYDELYSDVHIVEVPCTFNPFTKEEPKK